MIGSLHRGSTSAFGGAHSHKVFNESADDSILFGSSRWNDYEKRDFLKEVESSRRLSQMGQDLGADFQPVRIRPKTSVWDKNLS